MPEIIGIVKVDFTDLEDNRHVYLKGHVYPRKGYNPTDERVKSLASVENKRNEQMIYIVNDKLTKKELVEIANLASLDVDEKQTKAEIISAFESLV
ncbi:TPA: hypothetical protein ACKW2Y_001968 [Staphylococcus aureus]|uniref:Gp43 n=1 Tax=Staphylococcus phage vB_SauS-phiIPLA88 TaxID=2681608 RepID=B7T0D3_9CAUD|nr:hypothetical protein [Staphylococcus aureus]YP_002332518.1 Arc-like repressor [Staphylococcus phage vB_SauS-phiIPLA88]PTK04095.1 hypothetical protein BUZ90_16510 [Mammaliicoccus sciuri]ACJ64571.1 gp43 [Staphylococcus phage vB_SauS-phiIPLA88]MBI0977422.1 hypothetical protein [Staphylococcus aureus]MBW1315151.1 hypothetical protein [Staphylococcus aureus]MCE4969027.1 hypothetical protein [Staphylococcus aureus]